MVRFFYNYNKEKRKAIREKINKIIALREQQIKLIEKSFINPLKDDIKISKDFLKGNIEVEKYTKHNEDLHKYIHKWMEVVKK